MSVQAYNASVEALIEADPTTSADFLCDICGGRPESWRRAVLHGSGGFQVVCGECCDRYAPELLKVLDKYAAPPTDVVAVEADYPEHIQKAADEIMMEMGVPGSRSRAVAEFNRICADLLAAENRGH